MKLTFEELAYTIESFYSVETKDGEVIPFKLNNKQWQLIKNIINVVRNKIGGLRIIILKGRQFGFSTLILALFLTKCLLVPNTRAVVISHTEDATKKLFRRVRFFIKTFIAEPKLEKASEKEYTFPLTNSYFYIGTAGTKSFGRGDNITDLHCSEVAFWDNAATIMTGLLQAVGKTGNVIIETTANGVGNYFNRLWNRSADNEDATWDAQFYSWIDFDEYEMDPGPDFKRTQEEEYLCNKHKLLTDRKLAWRRWKINEIETDGSLSPEDIFRQEYPLTAEEAFIATGRPVFNQKALMAYQARPGEKEGFLTVWAGPENFKSYFLGVDVAEGNETGDYSVIEVLDNRLEQVAEWRGHIDPNELAHEAAKLAKWYNEGIVGVEVNNQGNATVRKLAEIYPIHKIYHREVMDENFKSMTKKIGWLTSEATRRILVADMITFVRDHTVKFFSQRLIDECLTFIRNAKGKPEAQEGCNDDTVIAMGIAIQMWKAFPYLATKPPAPPAGGAEKRFQERIRKLKAKTKKQGYIYI